MPKSTEPSDPKWREIEDLLDRALEFEPNDRTAFVREKCADNARLEQRVLALLANYDPAEDVLDRPIFEQAPELIAGAVEDLADETLHDTLVGARLAHFEILAKLGEGGMGEVYRALDTELGREVALKVLRRGFVEEPGRLERFRREARLLATLDHPAIVTIFSVEQSDGLHFLTMQLVEGETLDELIEPQGLDLDRFLDIAIALVEAVSAAHERGITHRDLKPSNVMRGDDDRLKVLDFGLAKLTEPEGAGGSSLRSNPTLTQEGLVAGHAQLHVAGTGARRHGGPSDRHLLPRCDALRDGDRREAVSR